MTAMTGTSTWRFGVSELLPGVLTGGAGTIAGTAKWWG